MLKHQSSFPIFYYESSSSWKERFSPTEFKNYSEFEFRMSALDLSDISLNESLSQSLSLKGTKTTSSKNFISESSKDLEIKLLSDRVTILETALNSLITRLNNDFNKKVVHDSFSGLDSPINISEFSSSMFDGFQQSLEKGLDKSIQNDKTPIEHLDQVFKNEITARLNEISNSIQSQDAKIAKIESDMQAFEKQTDFHGIIKDIKSDVDNLIIKSSKLSIEKVDLEILQELMTHVPTKSFLKKQIIQSNENFIRIVSESRRDNSDIENIVSEILENRRDNLNENLTDNLTDMVESRLEALVNQIDGVISEKINELGHDQIQEITSKLQILEAEIDRVDINMNKEEIIPSFDLESQLESLGRQITRSFDEKLFLICSDLSSCKQAYQLSLKTPFHRCGTWAWKSGQLKFGSTVPWNIETMNTDPDNFKWDADSTCIKIMDAGLYEISFCFFMKNKPSVALLVNGESVLTAINSSSYVIHHGSGMILDGDGRVTEGSVAGLSLLDFLALPAKSSVSLCITGKKAGHGFISLRRL